MYFFSCVAALMLAFPRFISIMCSVPDLASAARSTGPYGVLNSFSMLLIGSSSSSSMFLIILSRRWFSVFFIFGLFVDQFSICCAQMVFVMFTVIVSFFLVAIIWLSPY